KLIVADPRRSESGQRADLYLPVKPGEDPTLLAGIIHVILDEGLEDGDFVHGNVAGIEALREAVRDFTPEYVEQRAAVPAQHVVDAARLFANAQRGQITAGTGPNMSPRGNLTEYLIASLNAICGRMTREGEPVPNPFVLLPPQEFCAEAEQ